MPYIFLGIAAVCLIGEAWLHRPSTLGPWTFLTTAGAITVGDLLVTAILGMYEYRPGMLAHHPDNYLGVLIAECLFIPAYYAFLSQHSARNRYVVYCMAVIPVVLLEVLFLHLGVYFHRTWTLWHTVIAFLAYSLVAAYSAESFQRHGYTPVHRAILVAAVVLYAMNLWGLIPFGILRIASIHLNLVKSAERDLVLSSLLLHALPFTMTGMIGTWYRWTRRPAFLAAVGAGFGLWLKFLEYLGIWTGRPPWNPWLAGFFISLVMAGIGWVDAWFAAHVPRTIPPWEPPVVATRPRPRS